MARPWRKAPRWLAPAHVDPAVVMTIHSPFDDYRVQASRDGAKMMRALRWIYGPATFPTADAICNAGSSFSSSASSGIPSAAARGGGQCRGAAGDGDGRGRNAASTGLL